MGNPHPDLRPGPRHHSNDRRAQAGAPADLIFQSIAGSQKGNEAFGFSAKTLEEARAMALSRGTAEGPNVMYFETGQGSELSSEAHFGTDQVTMEARCYGFAKRFASPSW